MSQPKDVERLFGLAEQDAATRKNVVSLAGIDAGGQSKGGVTWAMLRGEEALPEPEVLPPIALDVIMADARGRASSKSARIVSREV